MPNICVNGHFVQKLLFGHAHASGAIAAAAAAAAEW